MAAKNQVILYSKPGCCLCDEVKERLLQLQRQRPFTLTEVNILEDREACAKFKAHIPVAFVNGVQAFRHYLDEKEFLKMLPRVPAAH